MERGRGSVGGGKEETEGARADERVRDGGRGRESERAEGEILRKGGG